MLQAVAQQHMSDRGSGCGGLANRCRQVIVALAPTLYMLFPTTCRYLDGKNQMLYPEPRDVFPCDLIHSGEQSWWVLSALLLPLTGQSLRACV